MSKPTDTFATIDVNALETVSGGSSRGSADSADAGVTAALGGIMDALTSLSSSQNKGPDMMQMAVFMMAMNSGVGQQQTTACAPQPTAWNYVNGQWTATY